MDRWAFAYLRYPLLSISITENWQIVKGYLSKLGKGVGMFYREQVEILKARVALAILKRARQVGSWVLDQMHAEPPARRTVQWGIRGREDLWKTRLERDRLALSAALVREAYRRVKLYDHERKLLAQVRVSLAGRLGGIETRVRGIERYTLGRKVKEGEK